ncbi:glutathione S-transferase family protein [Marinomonas pollencensis]|uniref:Putative glutathione S-transferase n=1 Tax=Marinomonas pollencensis TaxID=491954 RepID=A0A3E0DUF6_9GAMM|nr:glutathione S-transferase family protein [Marinomonas pollencensis]REG86538.1 putative glutathione S-transferase [Marinomonas pollencensis]
MLINGQWTQDWSPSDNKDSKGRYIRQLAGFRNWITATGIAGPTGEQGFVAEQGRYHLYAAYNCPWASRALTVLYLKGLEDCISVTFVNPKITDQGWKFEGFPLCEKEPLYGFDFLHQVYTKSDQQYSGRVTVPVLWDKKNQCIVSNESADIIRMFNSAFNEVTGSELDLYPEDLREEIDALNKAVYQNLNNGVYKAGFATTQSAYEEAYHAVFAQLDALESRLSDGRSFLFGERLTETDICAFVTLIRFDEVYHGLFKCNRNLLAQMPYLSAYTRRIYALPKIHQTVKFKHIKHHYYGIKALNPNGVIPLGPEGFAKKE